MCIRTIKERLVFLYTGISNHSQIVSFFPSSAKLTKAMLQKIDFDKAKVILEYGPGTGVFTREILKRGRPDLKVISFELNPTFFNYLQKDLKDPRHTGLNQGAETALQYLKESGIEKADYIVSSLPFSHIPEEIRVKVLSDAGKILRKGGKFSHYRYNSKFVAEMSKYFDDVEMQTVVLNIPPAYVYRGTILQD